MQKNKNKLTQKTILNGWKNIKLGDSFLAIRGGGTPSKEVSEYWDGEIPWATVKDVSNFSSMSTQDYITKEGLDNSSAHLVYAGTMVMPTRMLLGVSVFFDVDVAINQDLKAISFKDHFDKKFIYFWINKNSLRINRLGIGSTVAGISQNDLKAIKLTYPPLPEQKRIVAVLETWDEYLEKLDRKIAIKKNIKKGLMKELLTGKKRLKGYGGKWQMVKLGDICEISRGGSPRPIQQYLTQGNKGYNWLRIGDIGLNDRYIYKTKEKIIEDGLSKTTLVKSGDFILSNSMSFGRPYIMKTTACIHDGWLALKNIKRNYNKIFLYYFLLSNKMQSVFVSISAGSGVQNLKKESVSSVRIKVPLLKEQTAIANILTKTDDEIEILESKKAFVEAQKSYLLNNLITGTIRTPETLRGTL